MRIWPLAAVFALALTSGLAATRPPDPYVDRNTCQFECCHWGKWDVGKSFQLRDRPNGRTIAAVPAGGTVTGLEGWVISHPSRLIATHDLTDTPIRKGAAFYALSYAGGQLYLVWYRGKTYTVGAEEVPDAADTHDQWWLKVRTRKGLTGFVLFDEQFGGNRGCS